MKMQIIICLLLASNLAMSANRVPRNIARMMAQYGIPPQQTPEAWVRLAVAREYQAKLDQSRLNNFYYQDNERRYSVVCPTNCPKYMSCLNRPNEND